MTHGWTVRGLWARTASAPWWLRLTAAALVLDVLLLSTHALHHLGDVLDPHRNWFLLFRSTAVWNGGLDGSLLELFGQLQLGAAAVLLLVLGLRVPDHRVLVAWGGIFLAMTADDFLRLHERAGRLLGLDRVVPALTGSGAQELGGLVFWAVTALVIGTVLVLLHRRSAPAARSESWALLATLAPLGVVAAGYVMLSAFRPEIVDGPGGAAVVLIRMTVKLLTMTLLLVQAMRLRAARP